MPQTSKYGHPHATGPILKFKRHRFSFLYKDPVCPVEKKLNPINNVKILLGKDLISINYCTVYFFILQSTYFNEVFIYLPV